MFIQKIGNDYYVIDTRPCKIVKTKVGYEKDGIVYLYRSDAYALNEYEQEFRDDEEWMTNGPKHNGMRCFLFPKSIMESV